MVVKTSAVCCLCDITAATSRFSHAGESAECWSACGVIRLPISIGALIKFQLYSLTVWSLCLVKSVNHTAEHKTNVWHCFSGHMNIQLVQISQCLPLWCNETGSLLVATTGLYCYPFLSGDSNLFFSSKKSVWVPLKSPNTDPGRGVIVKVVSFLIVWILWKLVERGDGLKKSWKRWKDYFPSLKNRDNTSNIRLYMEK